MARYAGRTGRHVGLFNTVDDDDDRVHHGGRVLGSLAALAVGAAGAAGAALAAVVLAGGGGLLRKLHAALGIIDYDGAIAVALLRALALVSAVAVAALVRHVEVSELGDMELELLGLQLV